MKLNAFFNYLLEFWYRLTYAFQTNNTLLRNSWLGTFHSAYTWVIFESTVSINYKSFKVAYDCQFFYVKKLSEDSFFIEERFDVAKSSQTLIFGKWSSVDGLHVSEKEFFSRRTDLKGAALKVQRRHEVGVSNI